MSPWLTLTGHTTEQYCPDTETASASDAQQSDQSKQAERESDAQLLDVAPSNRGDTGALVLSGSELVREAVTKPLNLTEGDVIYFRVRIR